MISHYLDPPDYYTIYVHLLKIKSYEAIVVTVRDNSRRQFAGQLILIPLLTAYVIIQPNLPVKALAGVTSVSNSGHTAFLVFISDVRVGLMQLRL